MSFYLACFIITTIAKHVNKYAVVTYIGRQCLQLYGCEKALIPI